MSYILEIFTIYPEPITRQKNIEHNKIIKNINRVSTKNINIFFTLHILQVLQQPLEYIIISLHSSSLTAKLSFLLSFFWCDFAKWRLRKTQNLPLDLDDTFVSFASHLDDRSVTFAFILLFLFLEISDIKLSFFWIYSMQSWARYQQLARV